MKRYQYYKVVAATPSVAIGNPQKNVQAMLDICARVPKDTQLIVFPELCITGYTCQDLFYEDLLLRQAQKGLQEFLEAMPDQMAVLVGLPLQIQNKLYNAAAFCFDHHVLGFQLKTYIPSYNEFYETRWFTSGKNCPVDSMDWQGQTVPVSNGLVFYDSTTQACIGAELCEDLWVTIPVSSKLALAGANILCNLSASNDTIAKDVYRHQLVINQSARTYAGYVYASAGPQESTSDLVFSGHDLICENGTVLSERNYLDTNDFIVGEIDIQNLMNDRIHFKTSMEEEINDVRTITYASQPIDTIELHRTYDAYPFVPNDSEKRIRRCQNILNIQAQGLATRLSKIHCEHVVIGISGGLDSTLALLVCERAFQLCQYDPKNIHAISMPGFGTSVRTKTNADQLIDLIHASKETITIGDAVNQHFKDIHHDPEIMDITYENSQARERTQILMDLANQYNGIVIGTGDLSELALGWCTYNGDHMSMYAVNVSVPKTLVRYIVETRALQAQKEGQNALHDVLMDICDTPVSPELLPLDASGKIAQKTEEVLGSYDLHDFFLYHLLRHHEQPEKIFDLCVKAFPTIDKKTIKNGLLTFYRRFFAQQFKRNCMPDGVKVGSICLSPRGDLRMPSDASRDLWLQQVEAIEIE